MKESLFNKIDCIRIPVSSLEEGIEFYSKKLGHEILWKTETAIGLKLADDKSEIVIYNEPKGLEIDFKVKDTNKAVKTFTDAGGKLIYGPFDIPIGKCAVVKDPWDNQYIILDSSKGTFETDDNKKVIGLTKVE
ncbi:MAG: bleomycin resistance protein [Asgard group archaeon]|nr:bleomycin resistance protein [Asgard group archaeon]